MDVSAPFPLLVLLYATSDPRTLQLGTGDRGRGEEHEELAEHGCGGS